MSLDVKLTPLPQNLTPLPSVLLDYWMPRLKDTELRVLLLVARQTFGRAGKNADWLAHSQLKARTGRASEAISAAIDALVRSGLLEVFTTEGRALASPHERQTHRGALLYRIVPTALQVSSVTGKAKTETAKAKTTDYLEPHYSRYFRIPKSSQEDQTKIQQLKIEQQKQQIRERLGKIPISSPSRYPTTKRYSQSPFRRLP